jgi:hypothetical protein
MTAFIFEVWKGGSAHEDVAIVSDSQHEAEAELRVWGILFFGGITFKLKETLCAR